MDSLQAHTECIPSQSPSVYLCFSSSGLFGCVCSYFVSFCFVIRKQTLFTTHIQTQLRNADEFMLPGTATGPGGWQLVDERSVLPPDLVNTKRHLTATALTMNTGLVSSLSYLASPAPLLLIHYLQPSSFLCSRKSKLRD